MMEGKLEQVKWKNATNVEDLGRLLVNLVEGKLDGLRRAEIK